MMAPGMQRPPKPSRRPVLAFFGILGLLVAVGIVAGLLPRVARQRNLLAAAAETAAERPVVLVSPAHLAAAQETIDLPGDLQAIIESPIFARADGFMKTRLVDIGDRVRAGQLMAELETPELDQQINQARATLAQSQASLKELQADIALSKANLNLAKATLDRWLHLAEKGVVSRQEREEKEADFAVKQAQTEKAEATLATAQDTIRANQANLARLEEMKGFARVTAPFDGMVTARNVDVGTLINAGNGGSSREMFRVARIQPIRIFVNVPQSFVEEIHNRQTAALRVQELPGEVFSARVTNVANSLDANSRSMLVILETDNAAGKLKPGMYAQVRFAALRAKPALRVPGDTVMTDQAGSKVAVVGADHIVHFKSVSLGQDLGSEIEILSGLQAGALVISNPSDAVRENALVDVRNR
jgi:RND family efflux transporter MFP subunit